MCDETNWDEEAEMITTTRWGSRNERSNGFGEKAWGLNDYWQDGGFLAMVW